MNPVDTQDLNLLTCVLINSTYHIWDHLNYSFYNSFVAYAKVSFFFLHVCYGLFRKTMYLYTYFCSFSCPKDRQLKEKTLYWQCQTEMMKPLHQTTRRPKNTGQLHVLPTDCVLHWTCLAGEQHSFWKWLKL